MHPCSKSQAPPVQQISATSGAMCSGSSHRINEVDRGVKAPGAVAGCHCWSHDLDQAQFLFGLSRRPLAVKGHLGACCKAKGDIFVCATKEGSSSRKVDQGCFVSSVVFPCIGHGSNIHSASGVRPTYDQVEKLRCFELQRSRSVSWNVCWWGN
jgi:hypothetical protein